MKYFLLFVVFTTFFQVNVFAGCPSLEQGEAGPKGETGVNGNALLWAQYYNPAIQGNILPGDVIKLPLIAGNQSGEFTISSNEGVVIPSNGDYFFSFTLIGDVTTGPFPSVGIYVNNTLQTNAVFSEPSDTDVLAGEVILRLQLGDIITIRSVSLSSIFNTLIPSTLVISSPLPVSLTVLKLSE